MIKKTSKKKVMRKKTSKKSVKKKVVSKKLIKLNASSAEIWTNCPGFTTLDKDNKNIYQDRSAAEIGMLAHKMIEKYIAEQQKLKLNEWTLPDSYFIATFFKVSLDFRGVKNFLTAKDKIVLLKNLDEISEMVFFCYQRIYSDIQFLLEDLEIKEVKVGIEIKRQNDLNGVKLTGILDLFISNIAVIESNEISLSINVYDFKMGWLEIEAKNNIQLAIYAHQIVKSLVIEYCKKYKKIHINLNGVIIQPRLYQISGDEIPYIPSFIETLLQDAKDAQKNPEFICGKHCTYCQYNDVCKEFKKVFDKFLSPEYQDSQIDRPEKWSEILLYGSAISKMVSTVKSTALLAAQSGVDIPGFYLDYRGTRRTWMNQLSVKQICSKLKIKKADIIDEKIKSPPQIEKVLKASDDIKHKESLEVLREMVINPRVPVLKVRKD